MADRPYRNAMDYYSDNETDYRDPQLVAMLALTDALIDHRKAVEAESKEIQQYLIGISNAIIETNDKNRRGGR